MSNCGYLPMLAMPSAPFDSPDYLYEVKWDGIRALACVDSEGTVLYSRNGKDISQRYPELALTSYLKRVPAVLDGEIVVVQNGLPSFRTLQTRDCLQDPHKIRAAARNIPAIYMVFDILSLEGKDLTGLPLIKRKELLQGMVLDGSNFVISQHVLEAGKGLFELAKAKGLEGVMAKRLDSPYQAGKRSSYWLKFRNVKSMSCIICGYVPGRGVRTRLGSLILGVYENEELVYIGKVGSGLGRTEIDYLLNRFTQLIRHKCTFSRSPSLKDAVWLEPCVVCEVSYLEKGEVLRHPTFLGLRQDLSPRECILDQGRL